MPIKNHGEVSVIIASHRPAFIDECIESLRSKGVGAVLAEIIVVADYPVDACTLKHPDVSWIFVPDRSISAKRNKGIARSTGEILGFIDDDCIAGEGWVEKAVAFFRNRPDYAGVVGQTTIEQVEGPAFPKREFKRLEIPAWRTNNIFYRASVVKNVGGFDERFTVQREDIDLALSIREKGGAIGFSPEIRVVHRGRSHERWDLLKNCRNRRFDPLLYKKHARAYRAEIRSPFPPSIAVMLVVHALIVALWITGHSALYRVALGMCCMYAVALSARRNGAIVKCFGQVCRDCVSYVVSPYVLLSALFYGSMKFRSFLVF